MPIPIALPTRAARATALLCLCASVAQTGDFKFTKQRLSQAYDSEGAFAGDIDGDGKVDLVSGPYWYSGPAFLVRHEYQPVAALDPAGAKYTDNFMGWARDFDGDGRIDILMGGLPGDSAYWYKNPGPGEVGKTVSRWKKRAAFPDFGNESPELADLFGDGRPAAIYNTNDGYFCWAAPGPKGPDSAWVVHRISSRKGTGEYKYTHGLGYGDVNGDSRKDLLEKDGWWEQPASLAGDPVWKFHAAAFGRGGAQMLAYDVDGDGDNDVISTTEAHSFGLAWYENIPGIAGPVFKAHAILAAKGGPAIPGMPAFSQLHALALSDIDGDGLKDLITGKRKWAQGPGGDDEPGAPAVVYAFKLNRGDTVRFEAFPLDSASGIGTQLELHDMDGDGDQDILIGNKNGTFLFLKDGKSLRISQNTRNGRIGQAGPVSFLDVLGRDLGRGRSLWGPGVRSGYFTLARPERLE
jgi:hypothetical protein